MMTFLLWFISALATYRVSLMISRELGPFDIFRRLRAIDKCSKLLKCPYCVSVYVAALICVGWWWSGIQMAIPLWIILSLSLSAVSVALDRTFTSDFQT